jgi:GTP 3',8-cyclase
MDAVVTVFASTPMTLTDSYGRTIGDLRISITDRCNFRCGYCIPFEEVAWKPRHEILTYEEIERLTVIFLGFGVKKLRITGGEPLLRPGAAGLVGRIVALAGTDADVALTTNGRLLGNFAGMLRRSGLSRLNVSLDSLRPETFFAMTRRDVLGEVLEGIASAARAGFHPIKINAVVIRGVNDDEILSFAQFGREHGHTIRFIEFMPLDAGHRWTREQVVPGREIMETIAASFSLRKMDARDDAETARRYEYVDGSGEIGIITPVTDPFCGNCNRLRLTADGKLRTCLFSIVEHDLLSPMREGASDADIASIIRAAVAGKEAGHRVGRSDFEQPERTMSQIGG